MLARTLPSQITAAEVSSQDDSIPKIIVEDWFIKCNFENCLKPKTIKKRNKIMVFAAAFLVLMAVIISLIFYNAAFQTFLAKKYLHHLSNELNTTISVAEVDVSFFSEVTLKQLYVEDLQGDTLVYINKATINLGLFSWENKMVNISNIKLVKPYFNLHHPKDSVHNNLYFITNYFAPKEKSDTSSSPWQVNFESASIYQAQFTYNNDKIEALDYGVDYNHVDLTY